MSPKEEEIGITQNRSPKAAAHTWREVNSKLGASAAPQCLHVLGSHLPDEPLGRLLWEAGLRLEWSPWL